MAAHYDQPVLLPDARGGGFIWFMARDHLSPALRNDDEYALDASRWREAVSRRAVDLARHMGVRECDKVLDLGAGLGGPGRDIVADTGCRVQGINSSVEQIERHKRLSIEEGSEYTDVREGDMQDLDLDDGAFDAAFAINSIYHVSDPEAVVAGVRRALRPSGKFGIDDWFTTSQTSDESRAWLRRTWRTESGGFHDFEHFLEILGRYGFAVVETVDYTRDAGAFLAEDRFGRTYDEQVAPVLLRKFPRLYDDPDPAHARQAVGQLRADILQMGALYRTGEAVYRQVIAESAA